MPTISRMKHRLFLVAIGLVLVLSQPFVSRGEPGHKFVRWEKEIAAYEAQDRASPPPKGAALFIGSSTIRRWTTLAKDFPEHQVLNRGFGGSQIIDSTHFAERIIFPYAPRLIVLRAGGNDINAGKSSEEAFQDFRDFVTKVHGKLPETDIVFMSQNPTLARLKNREREQTMNRLIKEFVAGKPHLKYLEISDMVLGPDDLPRAELFVADKLHFNDAGYKLLAERVRPLLAR
jgi:lysophospholipase L1-like esterase